MHYIKIKKHVHTMERLNNKAAVAILFKCCIAVSNIDTTLPIRPKATKPVGNTNQS